MKIEEQVDSAAIVEVKRMWPGGPLREFSQKRFATATPYTSPILVGFAGRYVCDECQVPVVGVHRSIGTYSKGKWACRRCLDAARPKKALPEGLRRFQAARQVHRVQVDSADRQAQAVSS